MAGGLMQLVAYGAQDIYLTGNPQITFFKVVYRRHTNFALESIEQVFNGTADFGRKVSCTVSRNGDLIHRTYLEVVLPAMSMGSGNVHWTRYVGHALIDYVNIEIGGQEIDRHYGDWLNIWNELTQTSEKYDGYEVMVGNTTLLTASSNTSTPQTLIRVPLQFWFCRNPGLALPLIALQYHEVKFNVSFTPANQLYITSTNGVPTSGVPVMGDCALYIDYVYLDTDERRQFAQVQHEYLIEQLQFTGGETVAATSYKSKLALNHPCKELVWVLQLDTNTASGANRWSDYTNSGTTSGYFYNGNPAGGDVLVSAKLQLNGQDRFSVRDAQYFNLVQPYNHHTRCPATGIYVYSFALNPEQHQPSGTVNMSRIDNATLLLDLASSASSELRVYAVNYNVLRIMAGMGGLAYSN
jgi:hypothetical protein